MEKNKISLAIKTLSLLEKSSWEKISLIKVISGQKYNNIRNKNDLLININRYFDSLLRNNLGSLENSSTKDMLFEVMMERFDILNIYRISVKNLLKYFLSNPLHFIKLLPSFIESIILIANMSNINVSGVKGAAKVKIIFILYLLIIYTWNKDDTPSLEKTMTVLDKYLSNIDKYFKLSK